MRRDARIVIAPERPHRTPNQTSRLKRRAALASIVASVLVTLAKLLAALASGSLALLTDAANGLVDIAATAVTYFAIREAEKPADADHHYGHGKIESVAALGQSALLFVVAGIAGTEALRRVFGAATAEIETSIFVFAVLAFSICVDAARWRALTVVARETDSEALAADALHFLADLASSVVVIVALVAARLGRPEVDAMAAVVVSLFIAFAAYRLARRTVAVLLDTAPKGVAEQLRAMAAATPGVLDVEWTRVRPGGGALFAEIGVGVARTLPLDKVAALKAQILHQCMAIWPAADITVTANPRVLDDETVLERVLLIAARRRIPVHHVLVQRIEGRLCVGMDVEIDRRLSLAAAHAIATRMENAVRAELGPDVEVETHIEPLDVAHLDGEDIDRAETGRIGRVLADAADVAAPGLVHDVHKVRVRRNAKGLVVQFHCRVDATRDVGTIHGLVDAVEREAYARIPGALRIVGHAEPLKPKEE